MNHRDTRIHHDDATGVERERWATKRSRAFAWRREKARFGSSLISAPRYMGNCNDGSGQTRRSVGDVILLSDLADLV